MIYLANPCSHPDPAGQEQRFQAACQAAVALLRAGQAGVVADCPQPSPGGTRLPAGWYFWDRCDEVLRPCGELVVLMLDYWQESTGVRNEVRIAQEHGKPVRPLVSRTLTLAHVETEVTG